MTGLYLDAYSGISGDMLLGALLDLGASFDELTKRLAKLDVDNWTLEAPTVDRQGIRGTQVRVSISDDATQPHRHLSDIRALIEPADIEPQIKEDALGVFTALARAEAKVHGTTVEEVHFHEVGAVDAILDIVGVCAALYLLEVSEFGCSPLPLGTGFVNTAHGLLPVPAPATMELLSRRHAPVLLGQGEGEMVTPTGAALVAYFGRFDMAAPVRPERTGYGFGTRGLPWPNALRAILLRSEIGASQETEAVSVLECNIDDMNPEVYPYVIERLLEAGALDAWWAQIGMKKGRPAVLLSALAAEGNEAPLAGLLLRETTTLGVRYSPWRRFTADRCIKTVQTPYGEVRVKLKLLGDERVDAAPEYEDCARLARERGVPLRVVYAAASGAAKDALTHPARTGPTIPATGHARTRRGT